MRLHFEFEVLGIDDFLVRSVPSQEEAVRHTLRMVDPGRPLTEAEREAERFFDESDTWKKVWEPKDSRRVSKKRRRSDEISDASRCSEPDHEKSSSDDFVPQFD